MARRPDGNVSKSKVSDSVIVSQSLMSQSLIESVSPSVRARVTDRDVAHLKAYKICDMFTIEKKSVRMDMSLRGDVKKW